ncbi:Protein BFR2 [Phlyctema vagabunda]|uniref:Protein BFR2 n=1 Tax=Phlyctema vagabunda TaxID=108571 RepID=A0ABR4PFC5_9HELO
MGRSKTLAQQIAELEETAPKDFDPEEDAPAQDSDEESGSNESDDGLAGTEHYVDVGKSKLRKREEVALGPKYVGARVSREALLEEDGDSEIHLEDEEEASLSTPPTFADPEASDLEVDDEDIEIDSDEALGLSDDEKFKDFVFRGSKKPRAVNGKVKRAIAADFMSDSDNQEQDDEHISTADETDEDILDIDEQHADKLEESEPNASSDEDAMDEDEQQSEVDEDDEDEDDEDSEDEDNEEDETGDDEAAKRAELRKMMSEEQKTVVATISQAAKADADKGNAVKQQRKVFDSFLNVRIRLQKALVATNSMVAVDEKDSEATDEPYQKAQEAAIQLWNTLDTIRHQLSQANNPGSTDKKRKRIDIDTSSSKVWKRMKTSEVSFIDVRQTTLEKWSAKVKGATALPLSRKLNQPASQQTITSVLQEQLASSEHLIKRTKMPRSCAPVQVKLKVTEDANIYDDADFYQMLLKELVDQRMTDSSGAPATGNDNRPMQWTAVKEAKTRKNVDTKASKGRKMKFTVHEKLQNFMAPDDRGGWEQDAIDRFFSTLLGQKVSLGEEEQGDDEDGGGVPLEEEGLMLFRS